MENPAAELDAISATSCWEYSGSPSKLHRHEDLIDFDLTKKISDLLEIGYHYILCFHWWARQNWGFVLVLSCSELFFYLWWNLLGPA